MDPRIVLLIYAAYLVLMSLIAFAVYGKDKKMSKKGTEVRVKEKTLLGFAAVGGAIGALIGRIVFRHKTSKFYFSLVILVSLILQLGILAVCLFAAFA